MLDDRAFPRAQRDGLATNGQREAVTLRMRRPGIQVARWLDELSSAVGACAGENDVESLAGRGLWIEEIQIAAGMVDEPLAVGREAARIEVVVLRMAADILAAGQAGINIADALVVGDEVDARADPAGLCDVAVEVEQMVELI